MELSTLSLEAELATFAEKAEPGRTARIAIRHWGWDARGGATLEATGREFAGITRERVRHLYERLATRIRAPASAEGAAGRAGGASGRGAGRNGEAGVVPAPPVPTPALERALLQATGVVAFHDAGGFRESSARRLAAAPAAMADEH